MRFELKIISHIDIMLPSFLMSTVLHPSKESFAKGSAAASKGTREIAREALKAQNQRASQIANGKVAQRMCQYHSTPRRYAWEFLLGLNSTAPLLGTMYDTGRGGKQGLSLMRPTPYTHSPRGSPVYPVRMKSRGVPVCE